VIKLVQYILELFALLEKEVEMPVRFHTVITHDRLHPDEMEDLWLLVKFGERKFPGIRDARLVLWPAGARIPGGRSAEDYEKNGILLIGVGGGRFDEHPTIGRERIQGECAATLMAKELGVQEDPALTEILEFIRNNDLDGTGWGFDQFASIVDALHFENPNKPEIVISWSLMTLDALYNKQKRYATTAQDEGGYTMMLVTGELGTRGNPELVEILERIRTTKWSFDGFTNMLDAIRLQNPNNPEAVISWAAKVLNALYLKQKHYRTITKAEFNQHAVIEEIQSSHGMIRMITIESDDEMVARYARSNSGGNAAIVIQRESSGNVQIYANKRHGLILDDVTQMVRLSEEKLRNNVVTTEWKTLSSEGMVPGAENWFYTGQMLLNGSLTAKDVPPTMIPLDLIQQIVRIGINPMEFEPEHAPSCTMGICTSTRTYPCPWYQYGLSQCRTVRFNQHNRR